MIKIIWLKELKGELYTWKSAMWLLIASLLFSATSYLLLTNKELSLLDQTELLWLLSKIIIGVGLFIVTIEASSILNIEFEKDTAENLFLAPITLQEIVSGKILFIITLWIFIFIVSVPYIIVTSAGSSLAGSFMGYLLLLGTLAVLGFAMLAMGLSLMFRSAKNTLTTIMFVLLALTVPALFSTTLKTNSAAAFFSVINPIDNIFASMDNVLVDYQTHLSQNLKYIIPLLAFCALAFAALAICARQFSKKGITRFE
jgi:ABC-type transport system involved in multi-copper enzyme maturation permease subunit